MILASEDVGLADPQALPLAGSFYHVLRQAAPSSVENILVHGIGGTEQTAGLEPAEALLAFVEYAGGAPLVAYHADFDRAIARLEGQGCIALGPAKPAVAFDGAQVIFLFTPLKFIVELIDRPE